MSHVVPDLIQKVLKGQDPLHVLGDGEQVRHYTYGADLARGIVEAMSSPAAHNEDFNLSTAESTTVRQLAELIWTKINGDRPLSLHHDPAFEHDVQRRVPDVAKARDVLGFEATTTLSRDARRRHPVGAPGDGRRRDLTGQAGTPTMKACPPNSRHAQGDLR